MLAKPDDATIASSGIVLPGAVRQQAEGLGRFFDSQTTSCTAGSCHRTYRVMLPLFDPLRSKKRVSHQHTYLFRSEWRINAAQASANEMWKTCQCCKMWTGWARSLIYTYIYQSTFPLGVVSSRNTKLSQLQRDIGL